MRDSIVRLHCDICELTPFLEAYTQECDVVAEAGSRRGTSTVFMLNQHPRHFASLEIVVREQLLNLHTYHDKCASSEGLTASKTVIQRGDDVVVGLPVAPVELLFIDTVHNGNQLWKELQVFPSKVTKWLCFHDSYSYKHHDEFVSIKRSDVPAEVKDRLGLHWVLADFLAKNPDWVEEMNFMNNNGFYVLRRRSHVPVIPPVDAAKVRRIEEKTTASGCVDVKTTLDYLTSNITEQADVLMTQCRDGYAEQGLGGNPGIHRYPLCETFKQDILSRIGAHFYAKADVVPIFNKLGPLTGHVLASGNKPTFIVGKAAAPAPVVAAAEAAALMMVLVTRARSGGGLHVYPPSVSEQLCSEAVKALPQLRIGWNAARITYDVVSELPGSQVVILAASTLSDYSATETFQSTARIVVYGTSLADATKYMPTGFELVTSLQRGIGFAVWEKVGSKLMHYV